MPGFPSNLNFVLRQTSRSKPTSTRPLPLCCALSDSLSNAQSLLPALRDAQRVADEKQGPAEAANLAWRAGLEAEEAIRRTVHDSLDQLEKACSRVLAVPSSRLAGADRSDGSRPSPQEDMMLHHMDWRLNEFLTNNSNAQLWKSFKGGVTMNAFNSLGAAHLGTYWSSCSPARHDFQVRTD